MTFMVSFTGFNTSDAVLFWGSDEISGAVQVFSELFI